MPRLTARFLVVLSVVQWALSLTVPSSTTVFAGSTVTAVLPAPDVASTAAALYPDESQVGFPGPTVTGDEAFALQTAAAFSPLDSVSPLVRPQPADAQEDGFDVMQHWGNLAPAQSVESFGLDNASPLAPRGCEITQIHALNRHGARYPTEDSGVADWGNKVLAAANSTGFNTTGKLSFLQNWSFKLGAEILTPFGREQMYKLGVTLRMNYGHLLDGYPKQLVIRTTSEDRMVESAETFAQGFYGRNSQDSYHLLIMAETGTLNNTLASWLNCPNANNGINDLGFDNEAIWDQIYLKETLPRLQSMITGIKLEVDDVLSMQDLCAYETVSLGFSAFCDLFTEQEWKSYAYSSDISFVYSNGYGNIASSAQGIGYVQELVSRLEQKTISKFHSSVNSTIVTNPDLFPLDQPIYVDYTHDTVLTVIYAAMNFTSLARDAPIPLTHIPANRAWKTNELAPFGSSMIGQVMTCGNSTGPSHIRFLVNDAAMPLTGIIGCPDDKDGLCPLSTFIAGMNQRIAEVDWDHDCTANLTTPSGTIIDGQFPKK